MESVLEISELYECIILSRINLFTLLIKIDNKVLEAYINNTGRLRDYIIQGKKCYCTRVVRGRLRYRVIGIEDLGGAALVDTLIQEKAFIKLHEMNKIPWLMGLNLIKRNTRVDSEVIDFAFRDENRLVLVELKSAVMRLPGDYSGYPDAPTARGRRQINALIKHSEKGESILVFIAGIPRVNGVKLHCEIDREICRIARKAIDKGVLFKSINIYLDPASGSIVHGNLDLPVIIPSD